MYICCFHSKSKRNNKKKYIPEKQVLVNSKIAPPVDGWYFFLSSPRLLKPCMNKTVFNDFGLFS